MIKSENNQNGQFRTKKVYFTQVSNTALRDKTLSMKARGLYSVIQSYITMENFILYKTTLRKVFTEGDKAFGSAWNELKKSGYLLQYRLKDNKGIFYYEYELLETVSVVEPLKTLDSIHPPKRYPMDDVPCGKGGIYTNTYLNNTYIPKEKEAVGDFSNYNSITKEEIAATIMTDIDKLVELYTDNIGTVTKMVNDELKALLVNSSYQLIYKAFKRGIDNNSCKLSYIKALLINWNKENITTVAEVEDKFNKHKVKISKINKIKEKNKENYLVTNKTIYSNKRKSKGIFDSAEQRPYTDNELKDIENKLLGKY